MSAGGPIRFGRPKAPHEAPTPESPYFLDRLGGHVLNMLFLFFGICFQASFFVEFWDSCFMYVCWLHFSTFFEYFFHNNCPHLVLVSFCKRSIRKHVFRKSEGIDFNTFSTCFVDLAQSLVFFRFSDFL